MILDTIQSLVYSKNITGIYKDFNTTAYLTMQVYFNQKT